MSTINALQDTHDLIDKVGWVQCSCRAYNNDGEIVGYCLSSALSKTAENGKEYKDAVQALRVHTRSFLVTWNDKPGRTKQEVLDLLLTTIADLKEHNNEHS